MSWRRWLDNRIRFICREQTRVRGCKFNALIRAVPFDPVENTKILPEQTTEPDPDGFFTTDVDGNHHVVIPPNLGGRYILLAQVSWSKEPVIPLPINPVWTLENADTGFLFAFPAKAGDSPSSLPESRLTSTPVVHAKHTLQRIHWEGMLEAGDELVFCVQQTVSNNEPCQSPDGQESVIRIRAALDFALRRPGIQY